MKLSCHYDKEIDQNEIESKYVWKFPNWWYSKAIKRINLSNPMNYSSWTYDSSISIQYFKSLPNNQVFGLNIEGYNHLQYLFILDELFNLKKLETPIKIPLAYRYHAACFYDDSIFIFDAPGSNWERGVCRARRYFIKENKWINLSALPFECPKLCSGIKQKIIIIADTPGIWIYDIVLDSYSQHFPNEECWNLSSEQVLIKFKGRMYKISRLNANHVYYCDDPLSAWTYVCAFKDNLFCRVLLTRTFYEGSIYYFCRGTLYEFSLTKFEPKPANAIIMH
ncbi:unnamed protein product [Blepharisma stoltei]|uniref:F-box protein n=1 Tax=Blepharisma stoltei TaxID=1481888 RepID=A0AAU9IHS2_9CILI|nr:unnamed protein product [Blepharisma stoltei]